MATIKLKIRASSVPETEGTLYYQVIHKRSVKWISTGHHIYPSEWDGLAETLVIPRNGDRKAELLLMKSTIDWELRQRKEVIHKLEDIGNGFSLTELCEEFDQLSSCKTVFVFLQEQVTIQELMLRHGSAMTYSNAYQRFKEFRADVDLTFDQLTSDMIEEHEAWLTNRGLMQNTIRFYLRTLHTLLYKATDEGLLSDSNKLFKFRMQISTFTSLKKLQSKYAPMLAEAYVLHTADVEQKDGGVYLPLYMAGGRKLSLSIYCIKGSKKRFMFHFYA